MRAIWRVGLAMVVAGLMLGPAPALAQAAPDTTAAPPPADTVGPRELQNFSLNGTVTRQAETPPATRPAASRPAASPPATRPVAERAPPAAQAPSARSAASAPVTTPAQGTGQSAAPDLPTAATPPPPAPGFSPAVDTVAPALAPERPKLLLWPWLLLAAALGAAGAFLFWRRRQHHAFAGGPVVDAFVAPEPAPAPRPVPAPAPKAPPAKPVGVVSSRLRPWVEIAFAPLACTVDDDRITVDFEVQLTNTGTAPAREILVEASMFNAGATQDQDIGAFFANPVGQGERIQVIAPLQNISIRTSLVAPRQNIQEFELGGKKVFVPLVAFNALYRQGSGSGQTSAAYLLGRDTKSDKLGPLRIDLGARAFTSLGSRALPIAVRT